MTTYSVVFSVQRHSVAMEEQKTNEEVWKKYPKAEEYEVSTFGQVRKMQKMTGKWKMKDQSLGGPEQKQYFRTKIRGTMTGVHRLVLETFKPNDVVDSYFDRVDHIDGNPLNNHLSNLRWSNATLNALNQVNAKNASFHKQRKKWQAQVHVAGKLKYLGLFDTEEEATKVGREYRKAAFEGMQLWFNLLEDVLKEDIIKNGKNYFIRFGQRSWPHRRTGSDTPY